MKKLTNKDIEYIHKTFISVNNTDYNKTKYVPLPLHKNNKQWRWEGKDFPRVISLLEFEEYILKYDFKINNLLIFNYDSDPEIEYLEGRYINIDKINYEEDPVNHDLHSLNLQHKNYDFVCLHQTLEHIYNPYQCLINIKEHMADGGYLYINVPACNAPHSEPYHYFTGYTPMGLAAVCYQAGFELLNVGQWGNEEYLVKLWTRNPGWSDYTQLTTPGLNEYHNPVITWILAKKI